MAETKTHYDAGDGEPLCADSDELGFTPDDEIYSTEEELDVDCERCVELMLKEVEFEF